MPNRDAAGHPKKASFSKGQLGAFAGVGAFGVLGAFGVVGETVNDGGLILRMIGEFWSSIKVASPPLSMGCILAVIVLWNARERDREEHRQRTLDYVVGMNTAARVREADKREKAKLRETIATLQGGLGKRKGARA